MRRWRRNILNEDTAYIVQAQWELWTFDMETLKWKLAPQPLVLTCQGTAYDGGAAATDGHFNADLGFEHFFTGHAGLLAPGAAKNPFDSSDHPIEKTFRNWMTSVRESEAVSPEDAGKHPKTIRLGGSGGSRVAGGAQRIVERGRRQF